ncbi:MAG: RDD family protein [Luteolibacter sp.]
MDPDQEKNTPQGPPPPDAINRPTPPPNIPAPNIPPPNVSTPSPAPVNIPSPAAAVSEEVAPLKPAFSEPPPKPAEAAVAAEPEPEAGALASVNNRIVAALIDGLVCAMISFILGLILPNVLGTVGSLAAIGYWLTRDSLPFLGGQSIGKKVVKIQAVTKEGESLVNKWEPCLIRNAVSLVLSLVELIVLLTRDGKPEEGYRLGDEWAKTKVINVPASIPAA